MTTGKRATFGRRTFITASLAAVGLAAGGGSASGAEVDGGAEEATGEHFEVTKSEAEWRKILTADQFLVLRKHETEPAGSNPLNDEHRRGTFACAGCDLALFSSDTKFDSGTGWPSFYAPLPNAVATSVDHSYFAVRTEVHCRRCAG